MAIALLAGTIGCGSSSDSGTSGGGSSMDQMAAQLDVQDAARQKEEARLAAEKKAQEEAAAQAPPEVRVVTAHSPKKGRSLEGGGYLSVVTGTRFWAEHQLILDHILYATRLYEAEHGHYPKTQEEFMEKVIKPNEPATRLPELPEGWEYLYDPSEPLVLKMKNTGTGQEGGGLSRRAGVAAVQSLFAI
jgi:hypothetical protein